MDTNRSLLGGNDKKLFDELSCFLGNVAEYFIIKVVVTSGHVEECLLVGVPLKWRITGQTGGGGRGRGRGRFNKTKVTSNTTQHEMVCIEYIHTYICTHVHI